ncbi:MAG TPA: IS5/IS1182 family transposase, partial [Firmicutes bacterium]|nr:IS5/IS1182 family transposase [Bacillota bacterium]
AILADKIYRNRDNCSYCKKNGIRLSGPPLGRPPRDDRPNKELEKRDMKERNEIEGGFGVGKRRYGLARIMARLKETTESVIVLQFMVMILDRRLRSLFYHFYTPFWKIYLVKCR